MKPTVGRIVHYQAFGTPGGEYLSVPHAAVVTAADLQFPDGGAKLPKLDDEAAYKVALCVLYPNGQSFKLAIPYDADGKPGTWRWPPRE